MGNKKNKQLIYLALLLLVASFLAHKPAKTNNVVKPVALQMMLGPVEGYKLVENNPLDTQIITFLELDDYTQTKYEKNGSVVNLYIGYYNDLDTVSAAHSPLVCFPGQGWAIDTPIEQQIIVGQAEIDYVEMTAKIGEHHELVFYWYQADDKTEPSVYRNKINAVINKLTGKSQEHAFVRITVPFATKGGLNKEQARDLGKDFMLAFYPSFVRYLKSSTQVVH